MSVNDIKGIDFPFRFGANGHLVRASGMQKLVANMKTLILTRKGELSLEPAKGTTGFTRLFRSSGVAQQHVVSALVREALATFEPRVLVREVSIRVEQRQAGDTMLVDVDFKVRETQQTGSFQLRVGGDL